MDPRTPVYAEWVCIEIILNMPAHQISVPFALFNLMLYLFYKDSKQPWGY